MERITDRIQGLEQRAREARTLADGQYLHAEADRLRRTLGPRPFGIWSLRPLFRN